MNVFFKRAATLISLLCVCLAGYAFSDGLKKAVKLYDKGLWSSAMDLLQSLPESGDDPIVDGYTVLCAQKMHSDGYERLVEAYLREYPSGMMKNEVIREYAYDLFDRKEYARSLEFMEPYPINAVPKKETAMFLFRKGYCFYKADSCDVAMELFKQVGGMERCDYTAPSWYCIAYILYNRKNFSEAASWFEKASCDERFRQIADYYRVICHSQLKEYDKVLQQGIPLYCSHTIDPQRKHYLAKLISESYLVKGDKQKAREYFSQAGEEATRTRADYFYAGCLMFATDEFASAIDNYSQVTDTPDSLSQIAFYNTALAYIHLKNKVSALEAFGKAAQMEFDQKMTEDAFFNQAKLAFDINRDTGVFDRYLKRYSDSVRGIKIYSYMALSSLSDKDWQGAIDNYDRIENLSAKDENNYVHANYLRACQLLDNGDYRAAIPFFQTVEFLTPKEDRLNHLARFYCSMAQYRNSQWESAAEGFVSLYNASALFGMDENTELPYNAAYSYFKNAQYEQADKWFTTYLSQGEVSHRKDAMTRRADCRYMNGDYGNASDAYGQVVSEFQDVNDIYPYYSQAVCQGLAKRKKAKLETLKKLDGASPSAAMYSQAMFELSKAYQECGNMDAAAKTCRKIISDAPDSIYKAKAMLELGTIKRNAGFPDKALECYKAVVSSYPSCGFTEDALAAIESVYDSMHKPAHYLAYLEDIGRSSLKSEEEKQKMIYDAGEQIFHSGDNPGAIESFKEFREKYPQSALVPRADYYTGRSYENISDKVHACDFYRNALKGASAGESFIKDAWKRLASLSYSMENFADAQSAYSSLLALSDSAEDRLSALSGMMRCSYGAKDYAAAICRCDSVLALAGEDAALLRETKLMKARSLVSTSQRDAALPLLKELAGNAKTAEGSVAVYMLVCHCFDKAEYQNVIKMVKEFAASGTKDEYNLARSFIVLGDSYLELGKRKQAKATFKSIADGYTGSDDDVTAALEERLEKLNDIEL